MSILVPNGCIDLVSNADGQKACDAIQRQVALDFAPKWLQSDVIHYIGDSQTEKPQSGDRIVRIVKLSSDAGTLGSHWLDGAVPTGEVGVQTCKDDNVKWQSCLSHEILEMIGDPLATLCYQVGNLIWAGEVSDRVEDSDPTYIIDDVPVENFSLPSAFLEGSSGPWDFRGKCSSNIVLPNGYQLQVELGSGQWTQVTGALARKSKRVASETSRRAARMRRAGVKPSSLIVVPA